MQKYTLTAYSSSPRYILTRTPQYEGSPAGEPKQTPEKAGIGEIPLAAPTYSRTKGREWRGDNPLAPSDRRP